MRELKGNGMIKRVRAALREGLKGTAFLERLQGRRHHRRESYSQFGEDAHLLGVYQRLRYRRGIDVRRGLIVDVGAFRPIKYSNTYAFYKRGWRTINIDPTPGSMRPFDRVRPRDVNLEIAIGPERGRGVFFLFNNPSVFNTMDEASALAHAEKTGSTPERVMVEIKRLEDVLAEHLNGQSFEILSIDAEGFDLEILRSNDFSRFRPRLILIEVHGVTLENLAEQEVVRFLRPLGYRLHSWIEPDLLFVREDSLYDARDADENRQAGAVDDRSER